MTDHTDRLNRMNPPSHDASVGTALSEAITNFNALLAKLDADAGVTDTDYASTLALTALNSRTEV